MDIWDELLAMKTLHLIRHAEFSRKDESPADIDSPLPPDIKIERIILTRTLPVKRLRKKLL